ncbi:MAG: DUF3619 family protein [Betaproteobacteria bacterium]|jgi:hypothetical protein|nr:DUF3619 family protein [Betaproteobacteria bacterium]
MSQLIYRIRQALRQGEQDLSPKVVHALARARHAAVHRAESRRTYGAGQLASGVRFASRQVWGMGAAAASILAVVIGLGLAEEQSFEQNIGRIAAIDERVMLDRLPVQAYLDIGFLAFQEETLSESASGITVASLTHQAGAALRRFWTPDALFRGQSTQGLAWSKLTSSQREALAPLESNWPEMEEHRRRKWIKIADRFHQLSPEQQATAQERMLEWASLPASDRRQARAAFGGVTEAIPEDVRIMKWNEYQKLGPQEKQRLVELAQQKVAQASAPADAAGLTATPSETTRSALATRPAKPLSQ